MQIIFYQLNNNRSFICAFFSCRVSLLAKRVLLINKSISMAGIASSSRVEIANLPSPLLIQTNGSDNLMSPGAAVCAGMEKMSLNSPPVTQIFAARTLAKKIATDGGTDRGLPCWGHKGGSQTRIVSDTPRASDQPTAFAFRPPDQISSLTTSVPFRCAPQMIPPAPLPTSLSLSLPSPSLAHSPNPDPFPSPSLLPHLQTQQWSPQAALPSPSPLCLHSSLPLMSAAANITKNIGFASVSLSDSIYNSNHDLRLPVLPTFALESVRDELRFDFKNPSVPPSSTRSSFIHEKLSKTDPAFGSASIGKPVFISEDKMYIHTNRKNCAKHILAVVDPKHIGSRKFTLKTIKEFDKEDPIHECCAINNGRAVFGTVTGGMYMSDADDKIEKLRIPETGRTTIRSLQYDAATSSLLVLCENKIMIRDMNVHKEIGPTFEKDGGHFSSAIYKNNLISFTDEAQAMLLYDPRIGGSAISCYFLNRPPNKNPLVDEKIYAHERIDENNYIVGRGSGRMSLYDIRVPCVLVDTMNLSERRYGYDACVSAISTLSFVEDLSYDVGLSLEAPEIKRENKSLMKGEKNMDCCDDRDTHDLTYEKISQGSKAYKKLLISGYGGITIFKFNNCVFSTWKTNTSAPIRNNQVVTPEGKVVSGIVRFKDNVDYGATWGTDNAEIYWGSSNSCIGVIEP